MEALLKKEHHGHANLAHAFSVALDAWTAGHLALGEDASDEVPGHDEIRKHQREALAAFSFSASSRRRILPDAVRGTLSMNSTSRTRL